MPAKFAALLYPAFLMALAAGGSRSPSAKFARAGAFSPETSRRPSSLGIGALAPVKDLVKARVLVPVGDGRFYLDKPVYERRLWKMRLGVSLAMAMPFLLLGWVFWTRGLL